MNQEKIGKVIKDIRKNNHLSQKEFADKYNVTFQAVSKWENGKNIPDIEVLKKICDDYELDLNSFLDAKKVKKIRHIYIYLILILVIIGFFILLFFHTTGFEFKTLSSTCNDFTVTGSIAYNKKNSSIYISHVDYCGGDTNEKYKKLECNLIESNDGSKRKIDKCDYSGNLITLEDFLSNVTFNVDKYEQACKKYSDNNLLLEIKAISDNGEEENYLIPLKLLDNCK